MERQIKFRGKSLTKGRWVFGDPSILIWRGEKTKAIWNEKEWVPVNPETFGQFTGLLDKNGREIYEGDVILQQAYSGKKPMLVRFEHGAFVTGEHSGSSTAIRPMFIQKRCEVLGSIYDNPELLNEKER